MGNFIESLGMQAASGVISGAMGMMLGAQNDTRQIEQQQKLQDMQIKGSKELSDYQFAKQLQMWKDTSYSAQKEQMIKAGLNPGLMYGMSGGGGTTTGSAGGTVSGGNAPVGGREVQDMMGMGMQMQLLKAQKENIEADTKLKETDAAKTAGVDTELGKTQILNLAQDVRNKEAAEKLTIVETELKKLDTELKGRTMEDQVELATWTTQKTLEELDSINRANFIGKATQDKIIMKIKAEAVGALLENSLTRAQTANVKQATVESRQRVNTMIQELMIKWDTLSVQERDYELRNVAANFAQDPTREVVDVLTQAVDGIFRMGHQGIPKGTKPPEVKGFGR